VIFQLEYHKKRRKIILVVAPDLSQLFISRWERDSEEILFEKVCKKNWKAKIHFIMFLFYSKKFGAIISKLEKTFLQFGKKWRPPKSFFWFKIKGLLNYSTQISRNVSGFFETWKRFPRSFKKYLLFNFNNDKEINFEMFFNISLMFQMNENLFFSIYLRFLTISRGLILSRTLFLNYFILIQSILQSSIMPFFIQMNFCLSSKGEGIFYPDNQRRSKIKLGEDSRGIENHTVLSSFGEEIFRWNFNEAFFWEFFL